MANTRQLEKLRGDVAQWNAWRHDNPAVTPDLAGADLAKASLRGVDLHGADLRGAILRRATLVRGDFTGADLQSANLSRASLRDALLERANLYGADLHHAELRGAHLEAANLTLASMRKTSLQNATLHQARLIRTDFLGATLSGCDLSNAELCETNFSDTSLARTIGLDSCNHLAPSTIDHRTLDRSGRLPQPFLEGCGLPRALVTKLLVRDATLDCSCFISYSNHDEALARKLRSDLESRQIRCFLACDDMLAGDKILERVHREISERNRVLLLLSAASVQSEWVEREVKRALFEEERRRETVLIPISLDEAVASTNEAWAVHLRLDRMIADVSAWQDTQAWRLLLPKLVYSLTSQRDW